MSKRPDEDISRDEKGPVMIAQLMQELKAQGKDPNTLPKPSMFRKLHPEIWTWFLNRKGGKQKDARNCFDYQIRIWKAHFFPNGM